MIAGLPGTGLAGLFFILSALAMPFVQLARTVRGTTGSTWRVVVTHAGTAVGMIVAIDVAARLLRWLIGSSTSTTASGTGVAGMGDGIASFQLFGLPAVVVAVGSLTLLLTLSAVVGRISRRLPPPPRPEPAEVVALSHA